MSENTFSLGVSLGSGSKTAPWPCFTRRMGLLALGLLSGCAGLPTMQYCETVKYERVGNKIHVEADCQAPVGVGVSLPGM
jgi:hypothetical protein